MTQSTTTSPCPKIIDVAIIGGGVSGAYTAYRLMQSKKWKNSNIRLFEMSDRIGGRLWSIDLPDLPGLPVELGGMSFSRLQSNVYGLCEKLGLKPKPSTLYANDYLQYFREKHYLATDYKDDPSKVPFHLSKDEQGKYPGDLLGKVFDFVDKFTSKGGTTFNHEIQTKNEYLKGLTNLCGDNYLDKMFPVVDDLITFLREVEFRGTKLYQLGFDDVIADVLSTGGYHLIKAVADLHSIRGNWNLYDHCLLAMTSQLFRKNYYTLEKGYETLPRQLVHEFEAQGGVLKKKTQLMNLESVSSQGKPLIKLTLKENDRKVKCCARHVVLALPQHALKPFFGSQSIFPDKSYLLDTVTAIPAYKLMLVYEKKNGKNWWEEISKPIIKTTGFSLTDLNLQACYYVGGKSTKYGLVIASSGDTENNERFWSGYREKPEKREPSAKIDVTSRLVQQAQKQLKELHQYDIPDPKQALFWDWTDAPFGGGWHLWNPGEKSWEVAPTMRQPNKKLNVFVCGEAYSEQQGWVEGAINSAEMVLQKHFKLPRPSWVPKSYKFDV